MESDRNIHDCYQGPIRVLICNKYNLFREGLRSLLENGLPMEVAGEAATAGEAIEVLKRTRVDVVLLDATAPDATGTDTIRLMKHISPESKILILSMDDDEPIVSGCLQAGALGAVTRTDTAHSLKLTIGRVCGIGVKVA